MLLNKKTKKRLGRGIGSGKGKTCGKGHKGQCSRSGVSLKAFEGGQMPLMRRLPKRGFVKLKNDDASIVNFLDIQRVIDRGLLVSGDVVDLESLKKCGLIRCSTSKVKILANGELSTSLHFKVHAYSKSALDYLNSNKFVAEIV